MTDTLFNEDLSIKIRRMATDIFNDTRVEIDDWVKSDVAELLLEQVRQNVKENTGKEPDDYTDNVLYRLIYALVIASLEYYDYTDEARMADLEASED